MAGSNGIAAAFAQDERPWLLCSGPIQLFAAAARHRSGALLENRSARVAEVGLVLPQAVLDPGGVGNIAAAESEGVGRARGPLLGGAIILLRQGAVCAKERRGCRDEETVGFPNHVGSLLSLSVDQDFNDRTRAAKDGSSRRTPCCRKAEHGHFCFLTDPLVHGFFCPALYINYTV